MVLCFGLFAQILNYCTQKAQYKFVPRIAWIVDRWNSSLAVTLDFEVKDDDLDTMAGNKPVVTRLLHCTRSFELSGKSFEPSGKSLPSVEVAAERFKTKVIPCIDPDKIGKAVLAILYIISNDGTISAERKETFREHFGMYKDELLRQEKFYVPDFFARVLLYTTCVDNKEGGPYAKKITKTFVDEATAKSWADAKWDATTQTVEAIRSAETILWESINNISEMRISLFNEENNFIDYIALDTYGVNIRDIFPSKYRHIEFKSPEAKRAIMNKLSRHIKLVREFVESFAASQQRKMGQQVMWPIFPAEKMRDMYQQIIDLGKEITADLFTAGF